MYSKLFLLLVQTLSYTQHWKLSAKIDTELCRKAETLLQLDRRTEIGTTLARQNFFL